MVWPYKPALIFQEKAIFRKDSRKNDRWNDALGELPLVRSPARGVLHGKEVVLHQREHRMASLLLDKA
jgi:hypothetical protein